MTYFHPSIDRARDCRNAMDEALWASVRELLAGLASERVSARPDGAAHDAEPASLLDYGAYFDLVLTPPAEEKVPADAKAAAIARLRRRLPAAERLKRPAEPLRISNFSAEYYSADEIERMRRWWDIEPANRMALTCATDAEFARSCEAIEIAMGHLRDSLPELHGEILEIVRDIILAKPDGSNLIEYGGASSFALWGALTVNAETQVDWLQFYRQVVHEAGHNLLFGIAREQPLVLDDPSDRRASPIRADPRPMDGIFHAAFVSAREVLALDALLCRHEATGCLSADDAAMAEDLLQISALAFWDSVEAVRGGGAQLTELGDAVLSDCEAYMNATFAIETN